MIRTSRAAASLCLALSSSQALAHGGPDIGGFYQGMATVVLHWDQSLLLVAGGLWCAQQVETHQPYLGAALALGISAGFMLAFAGLTCPSPGLAAATAFALMGAAAAMQFNRYLFPSIALGAGAAITSGLALGTNELETLAQPLLFAAGLALGASMALFYIVAAVSRLPAGWPWIGVRVLGSWIAATGLMVCAYAFQPTA